ncbi:MAG: bestrophin family protein, partial [Burkholderiales bacterium]|nr:bestrophin family protein [Burkholderiales bacterium]
RSRTLARQLQYLSIDAAAGEDPRARTIRRAIAYAHALRHQLRGDDAKSDVSAWLTPEEWRGFEAARLGTDYLLRRSAAEVGAWLREGRLQPQMAAQIDQTLAALGAAQAGCERIKSTPIPFPYTLLLHRTAYLYCFLLPFGLTDVTGLLTPFVVAIVAYTFFGLDAVGDEIENPFGTSEHHLPLETLCQTIEADLLEACR